MALKGPDSHSGECSNSWKAGALLQGEEGKKGARDRRQFILPNPSIRKMPAEAIQGQRR